MSDQPANGSKRGWKATLRKLRLQPATEIPKRSQRYNSARHPRDVQDGYFSDSIFSLLHARGALHSESDLRRQSRLESDAQRQSRQESGVPVVLHPDEAPVLIEEAEVGESEEISPRTWNFECPGSEPIGMVTMRLVRDVFAKRFKRGSARSSHHESPASQSVVENNLEEVPTQQI